MKHLISTLLTLVTIVASSAAISFAAESQLLCHRTANEDVPENTLESLEQAALLGCSTVEIDLRRTLDGQIVLNHDGVLERLTDGIGDVESSSYEELRHLDAGTWMAPRFSGIRIARFVDALEIARAYKIQLVLDIKDKAVATDVLDILNREEMRDQVQFGGDWSGVKAVFSSARTPGDGAKWVGPGITSQEVNTLHQQGLVVVANFSANEHEMDLPAMKAAVAAGVDAINVDYPRLGAEAVGRPVEAMLHRLLVKANSGKADSRADAIRTLSRYQGFSLEGSYGRWILDSDPLVSRAAAEALAFQRPSPDLKILVQATYSPIAAVRQNAAWALGILHARSPLLVPLLSDPDPTVVQIALLSIADAPGPVSRLVLLRLLTSRHQKVRGAAARALAAHYPRLAVNAIGVQLDLEVTTERQLFDDRARRGNSTYTQLEIDTVMSSFRCQMEMVRALSSIPGSAATNELIRLALRPQKDFSQYNAILSAFQLWDRITSKPQPFIQALASGNIDVANRAEWTLVHANHAVMPAVRVAMQSKNAATRIRAIHIVANQGDTASRGPLQVIASGTSSDAALAKWAISKINELHPEF